MLIMGGHWSAYWYNGYIYGSEIARGLDILELTPTKNLTQNEIDAAREVRMSELNVQQQQRIVWPRTLTVAKAYVDQLERSGALSADRVADIRTAIQDAESSKKANKLKSLASFLTKQSKTLKGDDASRAQALAAILKKPTV
jgi:hypothetical protein